MSEAIAQLLQKANALSPDSGDYLKAELIKRVGVADAAPTEVSNLKQQLLSAQQENSQQQQYVSELEAVIVDFKGENAALQEQLATCNIEKSQGLQNLVEDEEEEQLDIPGELESRLLRSRSQRGTRERPYHALWAVWRT